MKCFKCKKNLTSHQLHWNYNNKLFLCLKCIDEGIENLHANPMYEKQQIFYKLIIESENLI